jgi:predicted hotdog family 3-hydroxylacyl-ACP dehydratase
MANEDEVGPASDDVEQRSRASTSSGRPRFAYRREGQAGRMRVAGLELAAHTVAELGRLLQEANCVQSAMRLGYPLGSNHSEFTVGPVEYDEIVTGP